MRKKKIIVVGIIIIFIILMFDQLSKAYMIGKKINIIGDFFKLNYTENKGIAFGIESDTIVIPTMLNILIFVAIIICIKKYNPKILIPLFFILAGGIGNLIDRLFRGFVIDFIDINLCNFPIFNLADISVTFGVLVISFFILNSMVKKTEE